MSVASLPRFRPGRGGFRVHGRRLILLAVLIAAFVFGAAGVAASDQNNGNDQNRPFRW